MACGALVSRRLFLVGRPLMGSGAALSADNGPPAAAGLKVIVPLAHRSSLSLTSDAGSMTMALLKVQSMKRENKKEKRVPVKSMAKRS
ncbi:MAG: hypothetical protein V6Z78_01925 [Holosporaceae bacterium]